MVQLLGTTTSKRTGRLANRPSQVLVGTCLLLIGVSSLVALPALPFAAESTVGRAVAVPSGSPVQTQSDARIEPLSELTEHLATAQKHLEELSRLTREVAADKSAADALEAQNQKISAEVRALHADRHQLREARDAAMTRTEDLGQALQQATSISHGLGEQIAAERERNSRLSRQEEALAAQLESLKSVNARAEAEVASLRGELESSQQRLTDAAEARTQAEAKAAALEDRSSEAGQQIVALETQVSALDNELKDKRAALEALASVRAESDQLRYRLAEIEAERKRGDDENERLSAELAGFRAAAEAATDMARQHLLTVEAKIRELNAASANLPPVAQAPREPKAEPGSGPALESALTELRPPSAASGGGLVDPEPPTKEPADGVQLIPPAQAADASPDSLLQVLIVDAMRKQREQLQGLMKELEDGRNPPR